MAKKKVKLTKKSVLSGEKSSEYHETVKMNFGGNIPYSVWNLTKSKDLMKLVNDTRPSRKTNDGETLSELNPDTIRRALKIWSEPKDKVLDPFLNRGTTPIISACMGRVGLGNDVVPKYVKEVKKQKENLLEKYNWAKNIFVACSDARNIVETVKNDFNLDRVDYIITSPPFWNIEKYVSIEGQMSDMDDYKRFLKDYGYIIKELYKIIKPDKFVTYIVNDFRRNKKYYWFSGDTIQKFLEAGFEIHDIVINVVRTPHISGVGDAINKYKRTLKYHEYVLTFVKK